MADQVTTRRNDEPPETHLASSLQSASINTGSNATVPTQRRLVRLRAAASEAELAASMRALSRSFSGDGPRYTVEGLLGRGAHGVVYSVRDHDCRRNVAIKVLHTQQLRSQDIDRFVHEAQITAQLEHPGVVPVHELGCLPDGTVYYAMKQVGGRSLAQVLRSDGGRLEHRFRLIELMVRICETLAYAHSRGVVHRDLKPANIMIGDYGEVMLCDWGLAKVTRNTDHESDFSGSASTITTLRSGEADPCATALGHAVGTPAYMSPEQSRGELDRVDARSDLYACGVMLYEMLAGESPYDRSGAQSVLDQVSLGRWRPLPRTAEVPPALRAIVSQCLAPEPQHRYASADALASDLRAWLAGGAVSVYRAPLAERITRMMARNRAALLAVGCALAVCIVIACGWWALDAQRSAMRIREIRREAGIAELAEQWNQARTLNERILTLSPNDRDAQRALERCERLAELEQKNKRILEDRARGEVLLREALVLAGPAADEAALNAAILRIQQARELGVVVDVEYKGLVTRLAQLTVQRETNKELAANRQQAERSRADAEREEAAGNLDAAIEHLSVTLHRLPTPDDAQRFTRLIERRQNLRRQAEEDAAKSASRSAMAAAAARRRDEARSLLAKAGIDLQAGRLTDARQSLMQAGGVDNSVEGYDEMAKAVLTAEYAQRMRTCDELLREAAEYDQRIDAASARLAELHATITRLNARLIDEGDISLRSSLAASEQEQRHLDSERALQQQRQLALLLRADSANPGYAPARQALADFFAARLIDAESNGLVSEAEAAAAQVRAWDDGRLRDLIAGLSTIRVPATAAAVQLHAIRPGPDRTWIATGTPLRITPGQTASVPFGQWLIVGGSASTARRLRRGEQLDVSMPTTPPPPGCAVVPLDQGRAIAMAKHETTCGEWLAFLNDPATRERIETARANGLSILVPRVDLDSDKPPLWRRRSNGTYSLERSDGVAIVADAPVSGISYDDIALYVAWRAKRDGIAWRLPTSSEWRSAVSAGDGRDFPWGSAKDPTLCLSALTKKAGDPWLRSCARFVADCSVHGIFDLAGSVAEFVEAEPGNDKRWVMGGSFLDFVSERFSVDSRRASDRRLTSLAFGFRLACDLK